MRKLVYVLIITILTFSIPIVYRVPYFLHLMIIVLMYITLASSWNIIGGFAGYASFGHMLFFGVGAYTSAILLRDYGLFPFLTSPLAGVTAILCGLIALPCLKLKGGYFAIVTLGLSYVGQIVAYNLDITGGGEGIMLPLVPWSTEFMKIPFYYGMLLIACATVFTSYKIKNSKFGLGLEAIREDEVKAEAVGINTTMYKSLAFIISAFFFGLVGGLYSYYVNFINPFNLFSFLIGLNILLMVYLGGIATVIGPILGAAIIPPLSELLRYSVISEAHMWLYGFLLVIIVLFMPNGLLPYFRKLYLFILKR